MRRGCDRTNANNLKERRIACIFVRFPARFNPVLEVYGLVPAEKRGGNGGVIRKIDSQHGRKTNEETGEGRLSESFEGNGICRTENYNRREGSRLPACLSDNTAFCTL